MWFFCYFATAVLVQVLFLKLGIESARPAAMFATFVIAGVITFMIWRLKNTFNSKCPNCNKLNALEETETVSLGEPVVGYKIINLHSSSRDRNGKITRRSTREERVRVTREPMLTTYICKYCSEEYQKEWEKEREV